MTETLRSTDYVDYHDAAVAILSRHSGIDAVNAFGLDDVFSAGNTDYSPAYAFLEAQGFAGVVTPALSLLGLAETGPAGSARDDDVRMLAVPFGRGSLVGVAGMVPRATVVVDRVGTGLVAVADAAPVPRGGAQADDYLTVFDLEAAHGDVLVAESDMRELRPAMRARIRLGAAAELLGICDRLIDDAVTHVRARHQFGQALADFQAVQHLLAWAATERHQLRCLFDLAVRKSEAEAPDPLLAEAVKAMAGRVFYAVAQSAIQVTGAISFTWEYSLNRLHHRGLALDQLAGPSADLVAEIGRRVRTQRLVEPLVELSDLAG